ncbi:hypothetical protein F5J12DRAFT_798461 [Pisolithus orientalis]|uniref:uncharacterized protein n=1 Tax=Pisolithus orientalis TaxID=936130 RepID=UPI002224A372|nr:uncharacterized protein F5J12DRAFT_798461 [Pisolithus orientalis]KAI6033054.1 hypothetical protein F5J12DRAFT_798461 [Pisolithus orientalis]
MLSFNSLLSLSTYFLHRLANNVDTSSVPFYNPSLEGGSMLENAGDSLGEPLNVIISGLSTPAVLTNDGIINYARAIGFSEECFNIHLGGLMSANLGDGNGWVNQTYELRQDYDNAGIGTCLESLVGGNHFRVFRQNGRLANSGALFLAVSQEEPATEHHDPVPDGYDVGRWVLPVYHLLVTAIQKVDSSNNLVAAAVGITSFNGVTYITTAKNITGLLPPGSEGINHGGQKFLTCSSFEPKAVQVLRKTGLPPC